MGGRVEDATGELLELLHGGHLGPTDAELGEGTLAGDVEAATADASEAHEGRVGWALCAELCETACGRVGPDALAGELHGLRGPRRVEELALQGLVDEVAVGRFELQTGEHALHVGRGGLGLGKVGAALADRGRGLVEEGKRLLLVRQGRELAHGGGRRCGGCSSGGSSRRGSCGRKGSTATVERSTE